MGLAYDFRAKVWMYSGEGAWFFITLPIEYADEIKMMTKGWPNKGYGTIKVEAGIGDVRWQTSIFPDKKSGSYLMPIKRDVRIRCQISDGTMVQIAVVLKCI